MPPLRSHVLLLLAAAVPAAVPADRYYPVEATLVPVSDRAQLQARLDAAGAIRLLPGDYRANGPAFVTLRSNQAIYGLPGTIFPHIVVAPGCTGARVSGVVANLVFPASPLPTSGNVFRRVTHGTGQVTGAVLVGNLFLDNAYWNWAIDTTSQGWLRDNRFIRQLYQATGDACVWTAAPGAAVPTTGNVMLWANFLTPPLRKYDLAGIDDLTIINYDCEAPNSNGSPGLRARGCGRLAVFETTGTNSLGPAIDAGARSLWLHGSMLYTQDGGASVVIPSDNSQGLVHTSFEIARSFSYAGTGTALRAFEVEGNQPPLLVLDGDSAPVAANPRQIAAILDATARSPRPVQWEAPSYRPPPSPAPPGYPAEPYGRAEIQARLDSQGTVILPAGVYVLDGPLVLGTGKTLVGAGMDATYLVAANRTIDLITDDGTADLAIADLTLQGGRDGIHHTIVGERKMQFTNSLVSHVCIRDMAAHGLYFSDIFGYDNNCFEHVYFVDCPSGFCQEAKVAGTENSPPAIANRISYMDKNVFYQCQWLGCGKALDLTATRASGGNCWINCRFSDSSQYVLRAANHNPATFVNCDLSGNAGHPVVNASGFVYLAGCRLTAGTAEPVDLVDASSLTLEGCTLARGGARASVLTSGQPTWIDLANPTNASNYANRRVQLFNNRSTDLPLGSYRTGMLVNNRFDADPDHSLRLGWKAGGRITALDASPADPGSRLVAGAVFPASQASEYPTTSTSLDFTSFSTAEGGSSGAHGCGVGLGGVMTLLPGVLLLRSRRDRRGRR